MNQRVFIAMHYMELGGAEISLIGLLQALDYTKYDVDLFIYSHHGELMQFIPKEVNLLPEIPAYAHIEKPIKDALLHGLLGIVWGRMKAKIRQRKYRPKDKTKSQGTIYQYVAQFVEPYLPSLKNYGEYDLAISYLQPHNYVLNKINAKRKACWIHTDYSNLEVDVETELPIWAAYDYIVSISEEASKTFLSVFPSLSGKVMLMENILSPLFVRQRAEEFDASKELVGGYVNLLSVGRFSEAKNYDNVPDICHRIIERGIDVRWFLIGFGGDEALIREKIMEAGMEEHVMILGKRTNPYPYIKACDIYCQPSRFEGKSVTVREAQILCKPVVVTDYPTAKSQIQNGIDGVIVPLDNERCAKGIAEFILDDKKQKQIVEYLHSHDYGNEGEISKIEELFN